MSPVRRSQRRPERAGGIESGAGERASRQDSHGDGQSNAEARDGFERAPFIHRGCKNNEDQEKSGHRFKGHSCSDGKISCELGRAQGHRAPGVIGNDGLQNKRGNGSADKLSGPVQQSFGRVDALGDPDADGHRGVKMAAGNVAKGGNHDADGEAVRERNAEKAEAAGAAQILVRADGAGSKENQGKRADEFRDEFLRDAIHGGFLPSWKGKRARFERVHSSRNAVANASPGEALRSVDLSPLAAGGKKTGKWKMEGGKGKMEIRKSKFPRTGSR